MHNCNKNRLAKFLTHTNCYKTWSKGDLYCLHACAMFIWLIENEFFQQYLLQYLDSAISWLNIMLIMCFAKSLAWMFCNSNCLFVAILLTRTLHNSANAWSATAT